jgi:hypothetical protein
MDVLKIEKYPLKPLVFSRRMSLILRMDNLVWDICTSLFRSDGTE